MTQFGFSDEVLAQIRSIFAQFKRIRRVQVFGSRALGHYREGSDIDLAISGESLSMDELLALRVRMDELDLPYRFDLVLLDQVTDASLLDRVSRVGVTIFARQD